MRKNGTCGTCGDGAIFDATKDDEDRPTWQCRCCLGHSTRKVYKTKKREAIKAKLDKWATEHGYVD